MLRTEGITLVEILVATILALILIGSIATIFIQSSRAGSTAQLNAYAADAVSDVTSAINTGNASFLQNRDLTTADLQLLAASNSRRNALRPGLTGQIRALGGDPPRYRVHIQGPDFTLDSQATAPGGTP